MATARREVGSDTEFGKGLGAVGHGKGESAREGCPGIC